MKAQVYMVTVVFDDDGNEISRSEVPFDPAFSSPSLPQRPTAPRAARPPQPLGALSSPHLGQGIDTSEGLAAFYGIEEEDDEDDDQVDDEPVFIGSRDLPSSRPLDPNMPIISLTETDPDVLEIFGKQAGNFQTQSVRPAVENGQIEIRSHRRNQSPAAADKAGSPVQSKPVEMTAARAKLLGYNVGPGGTNRMAVMGSQTNSHMASEADGDNASVMA